MRFIRSGLVLPCHDLSFAAGPASSSQEEEKPVPQFAIYGPHLIPLAEAGTVTSPLMKYGLNFKPKQVSWYEIASINMSY